MRQTNLPFQKLHATKKVNFFSKARTRTRTLTRTHIYTLIHTIALGKALRLSYYDLHGPFLNLSVTLLSILSKVSFVIQGPQLSFLFSPFFFPGEFGGRWEQTLHHLISIAGIELVGGVVPWLIFLFLCLALHLAARRFYFQRVHFYFPFFFFFKPLAIYFHGSNRWGRAKKKAPGALGCSGYVFGAVYEYRGGGII